MAWFDFPERWAWEESCGETRTLRVERHHPIRVPLPPGTPEHDAAMRYLVNCPHQWDLGRLSVNSTYYDDCLLCVGHCLNGCLAFRGLRVADGLPVSVRCAYRRPKRLPKVQHRVKRDIPEGLRELAYPGEHKDWIEGE